jgi:alkylation response protein AidB-like acyl-CoA dehydrogenase
MPTDPASPAAQLRSYLDAAVPAYRRRWGSDHGYEAALVWHKLLHAGGWAAPSWPIEAGGRGLGVADRVACDLVLAEAGAPMPAGVLGLNNVGPALIMFGTPAQRASLPRILAAEQIWAQGFSEPDAGSDLAGLRTRADPLAGGGYRINGQKVWMSNGMQATHCMLLARTDPDARAHGGISVLLVPMDTAGVERRPLRQLTGEAEFAEVFLTDVDLPAAALLGPLHGGWKVTMATLGYERSGVISLAGVLEREVRDLVGQAGVTDALARDALVRRWMEARLVGLLGARALAALADGEDPGPAQSVIKLAWSGATALLGETALDVRGPAGLSATDDAAFRFLRSRAATIAAGTTEVMKNILAERVLGLPKG